MPASPNSANYRIGKGIAHFKPSGPPARRDLGNWPSFVYTPAVENKEHFSARQASRPRTSP